MADLITVDQFADRTGRSFSATQATQVEALISDASALVVDIVNDATITDAWDAATADTVPASIVPVVKDMVLRSLDNPHGFTSETSEGYSYSGPGGTVFASREEVRAIRRAVKRSGVTAVDLSSYLPYSPADPVPMDGTA